MQQRPQNDNSAPNYHQQESQAYGNPSNQSRPGKKSYMEQKKEELARYMTQNNHAKGNQPQYQQIDQPSYEPQGYSHPQEQYQDQRQNQYEPQNAYRGQGYGPEDLPKDYTEEELRALAKAQVEYEMAQEREKMNQEQDPQGYAPQHGNPSAQNEQNNYGYNQPQKYSNPYDDYQDYKPRAQPASKPGNSTPAGGKSIRKESESNKFSLGGYEEKEPQNQAQKPKYSSFETSAGSYGNHDMGKLGTYKILSWVRNFSYIIFIGAMLNGRANKIFGKQTPQNEKGFNVITGEYRG